MSESPIETLLEAVDALDIERVMALYAPDARLLAVDGRRAEGKDAVREFFTAFRADLRSTSHRIIAQWHQDNVSIAEVEATYELRDWLQLKSLPRVFILYEGPEGITELHVYGAHERPLTEHRSGEAGWYLGDRWVPPL